MSSDRASLTSFLTVHCRNYELEGNYQVYFFKCFVPPTGVVLKGHPTMSTAVVALVPTTPHHSIYTRAQKKENKEIERFETKDFADKNPNT